MIVVPKFVKACRKMKNLYRTSSFCITSNDPLTHNVELELPYGFRSHRSAFRILETKSVEWALNHARSALNAIVRPGHLNYASLIHLVTVSRTHIGAESGSLAFTLVDGDPQKSVLVRAAFVSQRIPPHIQSHKESDKKGDQFPIGRQTIA